jgi:hypothetical protein
VESNFLDPSPLRVEVPRLPRLDCLCKHLQMNPSRPLRAARQKKKISDGLRFMAIPRGWTASAPCHVSRPLISWIQKNAAWGRGAVCLQFYASLPRQKTRATMKNPSPRRYILDPKNLSNDLSVCVLGSGRFYDAGCPQAALCRMRPGFSGLANITLEVYAGSSQL